VSPESPFVLSFFWRFQSDILDFGGLISGNQPAPVSSKSSKATSPTVAAQDEDFFGLSGTAGAAPKSTSGNAAKKASADNFDLFNLNTNGPSYVFWCIRFKFLSDSYF
jgi:hypothetical protein